MKINNPYDKKLIGLSTALLVAVAILIIALIVYGLYLINVIEIPKPLLDLISTPEITEIAPNKNLTDDKMFELLSNFSEEKQAVFFDITKEDLKEFLKDAPYIKEYFVTQRVYYYYEGTRVIYRHDIWIKNDKYRVDTYQGFEMIRSVICNGKEILIIDYTTYGEPIMKSYPVTEEFTFENQSGLPSVAEFLNEDLNIELKRDEGNNTYSVEYFYKDIPQTEKLVISFDYGLILDAEIKENNILVYNMDTSNFTFSVDDKIFDITLDK